ncbi:MAG: GH25 family lysozyme [Candidatus Obscuribacterales bacterium]|nr:GH25 family lysozyme [Candidatus Obscuribacterales bacterium]
MAGFDSSTASDNTPGAAHVHDALMKLSQEAHEIPTKPGMPASQSTPTETGRGHTMHAGNENKEAHVPPPKPTIGDHAVVNTSKGIDVSEFDNTIDWTQVQQSGVKFAFIRATDGTTIQDSSFVTNWQGAEQAGIPVGAYHYFSTSSAVQTQIDNFIKETKLVNAGNLPAVLDVEDPTQFSKLTTAQSVQMIQQWLDGVQQATGVQPMLYMSSSFSAEVLGNAPQFNKYQLWVADYTTAAQPVVPKPWTNWNFWQQTDSGKVTGIAGGVDLDYFNGPVQSLPVTNP